ncbi:SID1 transmembrane family member 1 [Hypsibius exemplaris]|uniref:SID1 transmembrane family member 1 n=1 Tax=Hypsibius exemplaris TaxID=2072580 RepID=A0A1W0X3J4_HYPEX|nr:SID1 transmembrane family member 1 [Hypsibius exemplaris]
MTECRGALKAALLVCLLFPCSYAWIRQFHSSAHLSIGQKFVPAEFNHTYRGQINSNESMIYAFNYTRLDNETDAIRVTVSSTNALETNPMLVVIKQQLGVLSWQVPLNVERIYPFLTTSRTLCPTINYHINGLNESAPPGEVVYQDLYVDLSTSSASNVDFEFRAFQVPDFFIEMNVPMIFNVTPSEPQYVEFEMPPGIDRVLVTIESLEDNKFCSYFSIQPVHCPVADEESQLRIEGYYQTVTSKGSIVVTRDDGYDKFYIVVTVKPVDFYCTQIEQIISPKNATYLRVKTVNITVTESLSSKGYTIAIVAAVAFFTGFYVITCALLASNIVKWKYCFGKMTEERVSQPDVDSHGKVLDALEKDLEGNPIPEPNGTEYASPSTSAKTTRGQSKTPSPNQSASDLAVSQRRTSVSSLEDEVDFIDDMSDDKNIVRGKTVVTVSDLTRKSRSRLSKKDRQYRWSMITICIFYGLPVAQLVLTYQRVLRSTGNEDLCYYNFACANPLGFLSDFNHVFSNIGYLMLGFLFILLVRRRQMQYIKSRNDEPAAEGKEKGIPPQFELFYAMGLALIMEGLMSGSYHVCPSYSNFQFDTSFMYLIGGLGMLKIYQARHPDIMPNAYLFYAFFALIILVTVLGVVYISISVWIGFSIILVVFTFGLSAQIYYLGRWSLDCGAPKRIYDRIRTDGLCSWPKHVDRFVLLTLVLLVNWTIAIMGPIWQPIDFASYILATFVCNYGMYVLFYMVMKLRSGERISRLTVLFILLACATWAGSLYMFYFSPINWQETPSQSRSINQPCSLLKFYDKHDIWHMMSACSLFFSFMVMLTLDDDLMTVFRKDIVVF